MNNKGSGFDERGLHVLQYGATSRDGIQFFMNDECWRFQGPTGETYISFGRISASASDVIINSVK